MTVHAQQLSKQYGKAFSLSIPNLGVPDGQAFGIVGNNGAGKTTFLRLVLDLILDEPFTNLDPRSQIQFKDHLQRLRQEEGTTMIISSHDLGHVTEVCDRIALLEDGEIVRDEVTTEDTLRELREYFADELRGNTRRELASP